MKIEKGILLKYEENEKEPLIPIEVKEIGDEAFAGCTGITAIVVPENVRVIGERAFAGCTNLKEVYLTSAVEIREQAFKDCVSMEMMYVPYNSEFRKNTFENCTGLRHFYRWDKLFLEITWMNGVGIPLTGHETLPYLMSESLPDCMFIRCNDILLDKYRDDLKGLVCFVEEREELYRKHYPESRRCRSAYDEYDYSLSEGKEVTVIGLGRVGCRIVKAASSYVSSDEVYYVGISPTVGDPVFTGLPQRISLYEYNYDNCHCSGLSAIGSPEEMMPDAVTYLHKYLPVIKNSRKILIAGDAAGMTANVMSQMIARIASFYEIPVKVFLTEPFFAEGRIMRQTGEETLRFMREMIGSENVITDGLILCDARRNDLMPFLKTKSEEIARKILIALSEEGIRKSNGAENMKHYSEMVLAKAEETMRLIYGDNYKETWRKYPYIFEYYCEMAEEDSTYWDDNLNKTYGTVVDVFAPAEYRNGNLIDELHRTLLCFIVHTDEGTECTGMYKFVYVKRDEFNCRILAGDRVLIVEQMIEGKFYTDIEQI